MRSLVCPYIAYFISAQSFWNVVLCTAVILTWSVQNIKNMCKLKGMLLTDEILRDLRLRLVSGGYPPTLDSPMGARFFFNYTVSRVSNLVWLRFVLVDCFFLSSLQSNMKSCAIFEIHRWSILLISILFSIFMLYIHPWARIVFHVHFHQLMIEIYLPKHSWNFYRCKV